jgi:hypothetical protein
LENAASLEAFPRAGNLETDSGSRKLGREMGEKRDDSLDVSFGYLPWRMRERPYSLNLKPFLMCRRNGMGLFAHERNP